MKLHEYQAREIFAAAGIPVLPGKLATTPEAAAEAAVEIGLPVAIKAQVLVGGRGKAGGVRLADNIEEVVRHARDILGMSLKGTRVTKVFVTPAVRFEREFYLGLTIDRRYKRQVMIASAAGGVEIEETARSSAEKVWKVHVHPLIGLQDYQIRAIGLRLFRNMHLLSSFCRVTGALYRLMIEKDCSLIEINPLVVIDGQRLLALDAKIVLDDNGLFRHPELEQLRDCSEEEPGERAARAAGLSYVRVGGSIGCIVNGAGLAMATMDLIKRRGGEPANFLDIGGSSSPDKMLTAMRILLSEHSVRSVFVNIFGGITRCDDVARGLLRAYQELSFNAPVVARLTGTNESEAAELLAGSPIILAGSFEEGVELAIEKSRSGYKGRNGFN